MYGARGWSWSRRRDAGGRVSIGTRGEERSIQIFSRRHATIAAASTISRVRDLQNLVQVHDGRSPISVILLGRMLGTRTGDARRDDVVRFRDFGCSSRP